MRGNGKHRHRSASVSHEHVTLTLAPTVAEAWIDAAAAYPSGFDIWWCNKHELGALEPDGACWSGCHLEIMRLVPRAPAADQLMQRIQESGSVSGTLPPYFGPDRRRIPDTEPLESDGVPSRGWPPAS